MSSTLVKAEPFFDHTWWEARVPAGWTFGQDRSIHGYPHVFEAASGARLWVGASKHVKLDGWDFSIAPADLTAAQQKAFLLAADDLSLRDVPLLDIPELVKAAEARRKAASARLRRHDFESLVGFTYEGPGDGRIGWAGWFSHEAWMLHAWFASAVGDESDSDTALAILGSFRFQRA